MYPLTSQCYSLYLIIILKCSPQIMKVVVVCLLQMMPHCSQHSSFSVTTSQILAGYSHMDQVPRTILVRFHHNTKHVIRRNPECVFDWIMHLSKLWLGSFPEVVHSFSDDFCCLLPVEIKSYLKSHDKNINPPLIG